jgi:hypothetical protein
VLLGEEVREMAFCSWAENNFGGVEIHILSHEQSFFDDVAVQPSRNDFG